MSDSIAVIIPAHHARVASGMLGEAVGSVLGQTLAPEEIHVAIDTMREGSAVTRTRALAAATTDWVAFLDSDDIMLPKHLQWMLAHAKATGADYVYSWFKIMLHTAYGRQVFENGEHDPFPLTHYTEPFDPNDPIETTVTVFVRRELAQQVGFANLDRGHALNAGDDRNFTLGCLAAGAKISHLVRRSWIWRHHALPDGRQGNTSGMAGHGDDA